MDEAPNHASASALPEARQAWTWYPGHLAQPSDFKTTAQDPAQPKKDIWLPLVLTGMPAQTVARPITWKCSASSPSPWDSKPCGGKHAARHRCMIGVCASWVIPSRPRPALLPKQSVHRTPGRRKLHAQDCCAVHQQTNKSFFWNLSSGSSYASHSHPAKESNGKPPAGRTGTSSTIHVPMMQPCSPETTAQQQEHDAGASVHMIANKAVPVDKQWPGHV